MLQQLITLDAAPAAAGGGMSGILMIVILIAIFYFMMIRPQQKKQKQIKAFREGLEGRQHYHRRWYIWQNQGDKGKRFHHFDC